MASLFGITSPKYQYAIDEYYRMKKEVRQSQCICMKGPFEAHGRSMLECADSALCFWLAPQEEEEEEENRMSEEAERRFDEQQQQGGQEATTEQPGGPASFLNVTFELEAEPHTVPAPIST